MTTSPADGASPRRRPIIEIKHVSKIYAMGEAEVHALRDVSLTIESGDFVAIMGASGSGKSTMMNILGCLDVPTKGWYWLDGVDVRRLDEVTLSVVRSRKIGFVFQAYNLIPRTTSLANVELPLAYAGVRPKERRARAIQALELVGLADHLEYRPNQMSGGQQQRVGVARAIVTNPALVLADEPTGNLDTVAAEDVMHIFSLLNAEGRTVVLITHEADLAEFAKRIIRLRDGEIVADVRTAPVEGSPPRLDAEHTIRTSSVAS